MKKLIRTISFVLLCTLLFSSVCMAAGEGMTAKENGILQVVVMYTDAEGNEHAVQGGSGFLIGAQDDEAEYIVTAKEVTYVEEETTAQVAELYQVEEKVTIEYRIRVVVKRDIMIDATLVAESDEMGFSVWKLSQPLYDRESYALCDDSASGLSGQRVTAIGFPTEPELTAETVYYTKEEVVMKEGKLIGDGREGNVKYLYHNIQPTSGMPGGPILNEDGNVIALLQSKEGQGGYYALQISELLPVLEALGIPYVTTGMLEEQRQAELAAIVHKEELQKGIQEAEAIDGSLYTKDTYAVLTTAIQEAHAVNDKEDATQEEVDDALKKLNNAADGLEEKTPLWIILVIAGAAVIIVILVFIIIWILSKPNRERKKQKKQEEFTVTQAPPVFTKNAVQKEDYRTLVNQSSQQLSQRIHTEPRRAEQIYGETTVFRQEETDTSVLRSGEKKQGAFLIRKRTGEKIALSQKDFVLGKDPTQTDYCITGNSAISRAHAVILYKGTGYAVSDKNATNGTFVNGIKVAAYQKVELNDGDIIRLADEDFELKLM